jgi:hypothetical protein
MFDMEGSASATRGMQAVTVVVPAGPGDDKMGA